MNKFKIITFVSVCIVGGLLSLSLDRKFKFTDNITNFLCKKDIAVGDDKKRKNYETNYVSDRRVLNKSWSEANKKIVSNIASEYKYVSEEKPEDNVIVMDANKITAGDIILNDSNKVKDFTDKNNIENNEN